MDEHARIAQSVTSKASRNPSFIVGVIGSAGALHGYKALLQALPANIGMAYVIISHMSASAESPLAKILSRHTTMPTRVAASGMPIRRDHVYVIPPNADLFIESHTFKVVSPRANRGNQGDLFLISLAEEVGARAVGIILSGCVSDGTEGCRYIKAKGGTTFAQDLSAEVGSMPKHAQASGKVDFILPPEKMPSKLKQLANGSRERGS
ncbi:MAG TPA: chemotaxis protein CheB [Verrucomicrobiae bacterium]|nr:chemotaxis protein CheB [Verrucomicrobiae bacterium]